MMLPAPEGLVIIEQRTLLPSRVIAVAETGDRDEWGDPVTQYLIADDGRPAWIIPGEDFRLEWAQGEPS